jgi:nitrate reductase alpha subunit
MGGFVRSTWPEVSELIAAAHVHTIRKYAPDRVVGFSPIPAMSQVSYAAGTRSLSMIGGTILLFYDWYADMPVASPQVFGDQTDVPESRTTPTTPSSPTTGWRPRPARAARWRWAMGHVILTEFFRDRQVEYFTEYVKTYTDAPFLVTLRHGGMPTFRTGSSARRTSATRPRALRTSPLSRTRRPGPLSPRTARWASGTPTAAWGGGTPACTGSTPC